MSRTSELLLRVVLQPLNKDPASIPFLPELKLVNFNFLLVVPALGKRFLPSSSTVVHETEPNAALHLLLVPVDVVEHSIEPFGLQQPHDGPTHK
jgi:hypothetical protein